MQTLPKDLWNEIAYHLPIQDIFQLCQVEKKFAALCNDQNLWKTIYQREFGNVSFPATSNWKNLVKQEWQRKQEVERLLRSVKEYYPRARFDKDYPNNIVVKNIPGRDFVFNPKLLRLREEYPTLDLDFHTLRGKFFITYTFHE